MRWRGLSFAFVSVVAGFLASIAQSATQPSALEYAQFALTHSGQASRGEVVFQDRLKSGCAICHSVDGSGSMVGPDLLSVAGKFSRADLIKAVLEPSANIAIGYATTRITTTTGDEYDGVLKRAPSAFVELMLADGRRMQIDSKEISSRKIAPLSLMPEGLHLALTRQEFSDLVAYLLTLRPEATPRPAPAGFLVNMPQAEKGATFTPYFPGNIRFELPSWFGEARGQSNKYLALETAGKVWMIERAGSSAEQRKILDMSASIHVGGGCGLLTCAFHPRFSENRKYYLKYHRRSDRINAVIVERQLTPDFRDDAGFARVILEIPCVTQYHTGGGMDFGPDGFLYIGMGDSGPQRDPRGHGQDLGTLLGKILRINVDESKEGGAYAIPPDNPFRNRTGARPEIWAYGFREPWRLTFDRENGDLWVGDVGQDRIEEVGIARAGENHGWNVYEGSEPFSDAFRRASESYQFPILSYLHSVGVSITGGYVYRGSRAPALRGFYICADFESRRVWALTQTNRTLGEIIEIGSAPSRPVSFTQGNDGELYLLGHDSGMIYHVDLSSVDTTPLKMETLAPTSERSGVMWRMTLRAPGEGWNETEFDDRAWTNALGGFGTADTPGALIGTEWRSQNIWLRREFKLPETFAAKAGRHLALRLHHDEDIVVYLNGALVTRHPRSTTEYIELPLSEDAVRALRPERNVLAVHCRQTRGGQYVDVGLIEYLQLEPNLK